MSLSISPSPFTKQKNFNFFSIHSKKIRSFRLVNVIWEILDNFNPMIHFFSNKYKYRIVVEFDKKKLKYLPNQCYEKEIKKTRWFCIDNVDSNMYMAELISRFFFQIIVSRTSNVSVSITPRNFGFFLKTRFNINKSNEIFDFFMLLFHTPSLAVQFVLNLYFV